LELDPDWDPAEEAEDEKYEQGKTELDPDWDPAEDDEDDGKMPFGPILEFVKDNSKPCNKRGSGGLHIDFGCAGQAYVHVDSGGDSKQPGDGKPAANGKPTSKPREVVLLDMLFPDNDDSNEHIKITFGAI
jgi:hypothetical protein